MMRLLLIALLLGGAISTPPASATLPEARTVVLLHGLARSPASMAKMAEALDAAGHRTCNIGYPSTAHAIATLVEAYVLPQVRACAGDAPVDFVTHSMGGILVRYMAAEGLIPEVGRVVMLGPPNHGSEVVDRLGDLWLFGVINGPAGRQLGTAPSSLPQQLGPATFEVGIITGSRSLNPMLSRMIEGDDDGKVSIERAKLDGMQDFLVLPVTHTFIMRDQAVITETLHFLSEGTFSSEAAPSP